MFSVLAAQTLGAVRSLMHSPDASLAVNACRNAASALQDKVFTDSREDATVTQMTPIFSQGERPLAHTYWGWESSHIEQLAEHDYLEDWPRTSVVQDS